MLRIVGGTVISDVATSSWMLLTTFLLALFIGFGKRRQELIGQQHGSNRTRKVLLEYDATTLDHFLTALAGAVIIVYSLFALSDYAVQRFETDLLVFTVPFVVFGLFRYIILMRGGSEGEDPSVLLIRDRPLVLVVVAWVVTVVVIIYLDRFVGSL